MVNLRRATYNAPLLLAALLPAAGCGQPSPPPQGAPQEATAPTIDIGTETGPQDSSAGSSDSPAESGTPSAEQGEKK